MTWYRLFMLTVIYYGYQRFQRIVSGQASKDGKKKNWSGEFKVEKTLMNAGGGWPEIIIEAALKCCFIKEKPPTTEKQPRSKRLLLYTVGICAGLSVLIWRRRVRRNQQVNGYIPPQQFNVSPEDKLKAYLNSGAGLIVNLEALLAVLELDHHYGTLHQNEVYTMGLLLSVTEQELIAFHIPQDDAIQMKTGVRWLHSLGRRNFAIV